MKLPKLFYFASLSFAAAISTSDALEPVTLVFQNGLDGYEGTFDRQISATGAVNGNAVTGYFVDGGASDVDDAGWQSAMIRFDGIESMIPAGAKIVEANLILVTTTVSNAQSNSAFNVYRLKTPFDENSSSDPESFGPDGLRGDIDWLVGSFHGMTTQGSVGVADVSRAVQSWVDGSPNLGLGIRCDWNIDGWNYHTTGAAQNDRPKLEVKYVVDDNVVIHEFQNGHNDYTGASDIYLNGTGATSISPGSTIIGRNVATAWIDGLNPPSTEPDISSMIRFDEVEAELSGRKVVSAKLRMVAGFSGNADSPGPFTVHRLLVPFTESSHYSDFAGSAGQMLDAGQISQPIATFTGIQDAEAVDVDISEAVKAWAAGAPNHGLYIGAGTANGWQVWTTGAYRIVNGVRVEEVTFRPMIRVVSEPTPPVELVGEVVESSRHTLGVPIELQVNTSLNPPATVEQVEYFIDDELVGSTTTEPFSISYPASQLGNYTLRAVMTDSTGEVISSDSVNFSVIPAAGAGGLYFDGLGDHIKLGNPAELGLTTFTLESWIRRELPGTATTTGTGGVVAVPLIAKGRNEGDNSTLDTNWFLGIREGTNGVLCADFEGAGGVNVPIFGKTVIPYGEWQHVSATFDGEKVRLYLNGNLEAEVSANGLVPRFDSIQHASIATAMNSSGLGEGAFGGFMDEVRIWNIARSQEEIRAAANTEVSTAPGLVARWGMQEGSGNTITSSSELETVGTFGLNPVWTEGQSFSNNVLPSVEFTFPENNRTFVNTVPLEIRVNAVDPDGGVAKVEYYDNGVLVGTSTTEPFSFSYVDPPVGTRRIEARVTDSSGAVSWSNDLLIAYVTFDTPAVPGYTAGVIDGKDEELSTGTPPADPAPWEVVASTPAPLAFDQPGTTPGEISVNINGEPLAFDSGIILATNTVLNGNLAPLDNLVAPYNAGGVYKVINRDNNGPGETEPELSVESSSFALGWFPFSNGWTGANISASGDVISGSSSLLSSVTITKVTANNALGTYDITGLPASGNMMVVATGEDTDNHGSATLTGETWRVTIRDNSERLEDGDFAILYIPETAHRVLSGSIENDGKFNALNEEAGILGATSRVTPQGYEITFGDGTLINPSNTSLFITPDPALGNGADNIYSYTANGNSFVVFSHDLPGLNRVFQAGGFRFLAAPMDPSAVAPNEVNLSVVDGYATEDGENRTLVFAISRRGNVDSDLTVNYTLGGTAIPGVDFEALPGSVTIPAGASTAQVMVNVLADDLLEQDETVTLSLDSGTGYTIGLYVSGTGTIIDAASTVPTRTLVFQQGLDGYTGTLQKRIGYNSGAENPFSETLGSAVQTYTIDGGIPDVNDMIRFDNIIGFEDWQVPFEAKVLRAELTYATGTGSNDQTNGPFVVGRLAVPFSVNTVYDPALVAGREGVRALMDSPWWVPVAGFPIAAQGQAVSADVTSIVREWALGTPNHGFGIYSGGTSDGWGYATIGNNNVALRPKLTVTFTTEETHEYTFTSDLSARINSSPGSSTVDGHTLTSPEFIANAMNDSQEAFLRFPVTFGGTEPDSIPADQEIVKAELMVRTASVYESLSGQSAGPIHVHRILEEWNTNSTYGLYGPRIGTHLAESSATMVGLGQDSVSWTDVTSIVRAWRAGAPNHGVSLKPGTTDTWMIYWPGDAYGETHVPRLRVTTATIGQVEPGDDPFELWAGLFGASGITINSGDDDNDGISTLVEYALGLDPRSADVLPGLMRDGSQVGLTFPKGSHAAGDSRVSYHIMSSVDLETWTEETSVVETAASISLSDEALNGGKKFFRLKVVYTP